MATRTIKSEKEKNLTVMLTPFIPCSAKLPIISLFSSYFFRKNSGMIAFSFYLLAIMIIIFSALLFKKINNKLFENAYIAELPEYRLPKIKQIIRDSFERVLDFVKRAGSIILLSSIVVWLLLSFSMKLEYGTNIENSILASVGRTFSWLFIPIVGENSWEVAVSTIQGLIAKEQVISSMSIIAGLDTENILNNIFSIGSPFEFFTPAASYAFVCFNLFSAPCIGAISAMKKAFGSNKNMFKAVMYQMIVAYIASSLVYLVAKAII